LGRNQDEGGAIILGLSSVLFAFRPPLMFFSLIFLQILSFSALFRVCLPLFSSSSPLILLTFHDFVVNNPWLAIIAVLEIFLIKIKPIPRSFIQNLLGVDCFPIPNRVINRNLGHSLRLPLGCSFMF
jgi:hypothetical protein